MNVSCVQLMHCRCQAESSNPVGALRARGEPLHEFIPQLVNIIQVSVEGLVVLVLLSANLN